MNNYYNGIPQYYMPYTTPRFFNARLSSPFLKINKINFNNILNSASKTLGVINQAIPVFYQIKPLWQNTKTMLRVAKIIKNDEPATSKTTNNSSNANNSSSTNPSFFI